MKINLLAFSLILSTANCLAAADDALANFKKMASQIETADIASLPMQSSGRIKSMLSLGRESLLFIYGKYRPFGLSPLQAYFGLMLDEHASELELINIRDPSLREDLGFDKSHRWFSLVELDSSRLQDLASVLMKKSQKNQKSLNDKENKTLEAYQQYSLAKELLSGDLFFSSLGTHAMGGGGTGEHDNSAAINQAQLVMKSLAEKNTADFKVQLEKLKTLQFQTLDVNNENARAKLDVEVNYLGLQPFFWAAILYLFIGCLFFAWSPKTSSIPMIPLLAALAPMLLQIVGFGMRIFVTGFAPVTNMYGTMLWVSLGVVAFGMILLGLYRNLKLYAFLLFASGSLLLLTESLPLVLSPDMDPIVAVLRSNFWLSIHVLTITISYAAFTIAMLIGNAVLIRILLPKASKIDFAELARHNYRVIQLGVFLLTAGIILGGIWADYSWGRFWGWDPKETWALIADLGFIAILHARHIGWLKDFGLLACSPIGYLLVVMAWYGVNFILAAGLHSYGFSSGGAAAVAIFVSAQILLLIAAGIKMKTLKTSPT